MDEKKYSQLYQALLQEVLQFHNGNQRRIRKGMLSLLLVPLVFLVLLFLSEGSRVIFLLLWIVSMFGIAAYLIAVEYIDYEMQNKVKKITKKEVELDQLTPLPSAMPQLLPLLRGRGQEPDLPPDPPQEEQESFAQSAAQAEEDLDQLLQGLRGIETAAAPEPQLRPPVRRPGLGPVLRFPRGGDACGGAGIRDGIRGGAGIRDGIRGGARPRFRARLRPGKSCPRPAGVHPCPAGIPGRPAACCP